MGLLIPLLLFLTAADSGFARPLPTRTAGEQPPVVEPSANTNASAFPSPKPVVHPEPKPGEEVRKPTAEKVRRATLPAAHTPARHGDTSGSYLVGQRTLVEDYCGWGWVRKEGEGWNKGRWIAIEYDPKVCPVPHAFLPRPGDDKDYLYQLYGQVAPYRAYEPQADVWVDVFLIKGFVSLGPAKQTIRRLPPHHGSSRPNRFAERGANLR
jgi:hypothetical protein